MIASLASRIASMRSSACCFSILAMIGNGVSARTSAMSFSWRTYESAM